MSEELKCLGQAHGKKRAASDFRFDITAQVVSMSPEAAVFLIDLYPEKKLNDPQVEPM